MNTKDICDVCGGIDEACVCLCEPASSSINPVVQRLARHLAGRRKAVESSVASERLAGNKWKEECERCALAEITAMEIWVAQGCR